MVGVGCRGSPRFPGLFRVVGHQSGPFPALGASLCSLSPHPSAFLSSSWSEAVLAGSKGPSLGWGSTGRARAALIVGGPGQRRAWAQQGWKQRSTPYSHRPRQALTKAEVGRCTQRDRQPLGRLLCGCLAGGSGAAKSIFCINYVSCYCSLGVALL